MGTSTTAPVLEIDRIGHDEAMRLTATENGRLLDLLRQLGPADWTAPTDCPRWSVRDMGVHLIGSAQAQANPVEFARQLWAGRPLTAQIGGTHWVDGLNEAQLRARRGWTAGELPGRWEKAAAAALTARRRMPAPIRVLPLLPLGTALGTDLGWQPLGYLFDIGFTRDVWMHRVDISRAVGRPLTLTAEHDGRIVADIVAEWAQLHDEPFILELAGPAGGGTPPGAAPHRSPWTRSSSSGSSPAGARATACSGTSCPCSRRRDREGAGEPAPPCPCPGLAPMPFS